MTELFASEKTQERYRKVLAAAMPHLEGYDEVHILSEEDLKTLAPDKGPQSDFGLRDISSMMRGGQLVDKLTESLDVGQILATESLFKRISNDDERRKLGPLAFSIQIPDVELPKDYKVGFVVLPKFDPKILIKDFGFPDVGRDAIGIEIADDLVLAHEMGHLADNLERGITRLDRIVPDRELLLEKQGREKAADQFGLNITSHIHEGHETWGKVENAFTNARSAMGVWSLAFRKPDPHFTTPFLNGGDLQDLPFDKVIDTAPAISGATDRKIMQIFHAALDARKEKNEDVPRRDIECVDRAFSVSAKSKESSLAMDKMFKIKLEYEAPSLYDTFKDCANRKLDFRTRVLSAMRYEFEDGTPERRILDHYMDVATRAGLDKPASPLPFQDPPLQQNWIKKPELQSP